MTTCKQLKQHLVEHGLDALRADQQLVDHLSSCTQCNALLDAYAATPALLDNLPDHEPSEALIASTIEAIEASSIGRTTNTWWNRQTAMAMGTAVVLLAVFGLTPQFLIQDRSLDYSQPSTPYTVQRENVAPQREAASESEFRHADGKEQSKARFASLESASDDHVTGDSISVVDGERLSAHRDDDRAETDGYSYAENESAGKEQVAPTVVGGLAGSDTAQNLEVPAGRLEELFRDAQDRGAYEKSENEIGAGTTVPDVDGPVPTIELNARVNGVPSKSNTSDLDPLLNATRDLQSLRESSRTREFANATDPGEEQADGNLGLSSAERDALTQQIGGRHSERGQVYPDLTKPSDVEIDKQLQEFTFGQKNKVPIAAQNRSGSSVDEIVVTGNRITHFGVGGFDFLEHYQQTSDLSFQSPEGYWANSYVPGDPQIRLLSARLARWDRTALGESWRLEQDVTPIKQPFDAPENNALALTLMGDANAVEGQTRMRLQVGIRGIEHLRGRRPAMNLAVVVDLPDDADDSVRIASRTLLEALLSAKQSGDRFSLVMSGGPESLTITPEEFRFGPLQLATQAILGQQPRSAGVGSSLLDAIRSATKLVKSGDDPSRPLGSSAILLISAGGLTDVGALAEFAHQQARDGITFSVISLGDRPRSADVEKLVLAGLGNRRYLESPDRARALIEEELHSSSRAVARAARLSIRLAPGVHLVEVVGSRRLELADSERVKEIETAMDQRLRSNLGIEADRGDDEDGIQIIIPSVFADDSLTVLVDVVVDQAGPIADVSLRYKDLVFKKNGTLRSRFTLAEGPLSRGPSELVVMKNLLAYHFSQSVTEAAEALGREQVELAAAELAAARSTLTQLRSQINAWEDDPELLRDQQILERYIGVLNSPEATTRQALLADSLRYAAWAKAHRSPACIVNEQCEPAE